MYHQGSFYAPLLIPLTFYPKIFRNMLTDETLDSKKMVLSIQFRVDEKYISVRLYARCAGWFDGRQAATRSDCFGCTLATCSFPISSPSKVKFHFQRPTFLGLYCCCKGSCWKITKAWYKKHSAGHCQKCYRSMVRLRYGRLRSNCN